MSLYKNSGTPISGYVSLTNATPSASIVLQAVSNGSTYTLAPGELVIIVSYAFSSNDPANQLVTLDDGATIGSFTKRTILSAYTGAALRAPYQTLVPGCPCRRGTNPRATASAVGVGKTVEVVIVGYVTTTT